MILSKSIMDYNSSISSTKMKYLEYKELCEKIKSIFSLEGFGSLGYNNVCRKVLDASVYLKLYNIGK